MDGGAWWAAVHGVIKSRTRLSNFIYLLTYLLTCSQDAFVVPECIGVALVLISKC